MVKDISDRKIQILEADTKHLDKMADIFKHGQQPHHVQFPKIFGPADDKNAILQYLRGFLKPRNPFRTRRNYAAVWLVGDEPCGYLLYQFYETFNVFHGRNHWVCFVEDIAINPEMRSRGGASQLLDYLTVKIEALDHCIASANIWRGNKASEALFRKYGFDDLSKTYYRVIG